MTETDGPTEAALDAALADWLRTGRPAASVLRADPDRLLHRIDLNGLGPLLAREPATGLSEALRRGLHARLVGREMWEAQHRLVVMQALAALRAAGLRPLLMKGTAMAWRHYAEPALRVRGDSDILVDAGGREAAMAALAAAGFAHALDAGGQTRVAETLFRKADLAGLPHDIDLHWALSSAPVIAGLFSHRALCEEAVALPGLGPEARAMGDVPALVFACVHRAKHLVEGHVYTLNGRQYRPGDNLVWLMDIHLLAGALTPAGQEALLRLARDRGLAPVLAEALRTTRARLGTALPAGLLPALEALPPGRIARYLAAPAPRRLAMDLAALPGPAARLRFVAESVFPDPAYMRVRFAGARLRWLPWLYLRRGVRGIAKRLSPRGLP